MKNFNIYFYAQSLDNLSQDDIYQVIISENNLVKIENLLDRQKVTQLISKIFSANMSYEEDPKLKVYMYSIKEDNDKYHILVKFDTNQKDDLGRSSINHLVLENVNFKLKSPLNNLVKYYNLENYITDFLRKTDRGEFQGHLNDLNDILDRFKKKQNKMKIMLWTMLSAGLIILLILLVKK